MSPPLEKVRELPFRAPSEKEVASVPNSILPGLAPAERVTSPEEGRVVEPRNGVGAPVSAGVKITTAR